MSHLSSTAELPFLPAINRFQVDCGEAPTKVGFMLLARARKVSALMAAGLLFAWGAFGQGEGEGGVIRVQFLGLKSDQGEITLCVHDRTTMTKANLKRKDNADAVLRTNIAVRGLTASWVSPDLPLGDYALLAYHDRNGNGKCDLGLIGTERVGASNYAKPLLGYPAFSKAQFRLEKGGAAVSLVLQKPGLRLLPPY